MPLVFTHLDLRLKNIMLGTDGKIWIMDWEAAGFYPRWFEYASMMRYREDDPPSWVKAIPYIVGNHEKQAQFIEVIEYGLIEGRYFDRGLSNPSNLMLIKRILPDVYTFVEGQFRIPSRFLRSGRK